MEPEDTERLNPILRRLGRSRARARLVLLFERVWPALWPPLGVIGALVCAALLELPSMLPPWAHLSLLAVAAIVVLALLGRGIIGVATPNVAEADRRLETASGLQPPPLVGAHRPPRRCLAPRCCGRPMSPAPPPRSCRLRVGLPRPGLAARDPRALRGRLMVALAACLVIAGAETPYRLSPRAQPRFRAAGGTCQHPVAGLDHPARLYGPRTAVPEARGRRRLGARRHRISRSNLTGGAGIPSLTLDGHATAFETLDDASFQADQDLDVRRPPAGSPPGPRAWRVGADGGHRSRAPGQLPRAARHRQEHRVRRKCACPGRFRMNTAWSP